MHKFEVLSMCAACRGYCNVKYTFVIRTTKQNNIYRIFYYGESQKSKAPQILVNCVLGLG